MSADVGDASCPITPGGDAVTLTVTTPGQNAIYTFSGTNGERISLTLSRTGIPDVYILSIKNPDGSYLYGPQNGTPAFVDATALLQAGTYTILVDVAGTSTGSVTAQLFDVVDASGSPTRGG